MFFSVPFSTLAPPTQTKSPTHRESSDSPFANQTYFCHYHSEECGFWCSTCSRKCCQTCLRQPEYHAGHDVVSIGHQNDPSPISPRDQNQQHQEMSHFLNHANQICSQMESCLTELRVYNQTIQDNHITASSDLKK